MRDSLKGLKRGVRPVEVVVDPGLQLVEHLLGLPDEPAVHEGRHVSIFVVQEDHSHAAANTGV